MKKLLMWLIAFCIPLGLGIYLGCRHQQSTIDALEQKLAAYKELGKTIEALKEGVEKQLADNNKSIVVAYEQELKNILGRFTNAAEVVNNESALLHKRANAADAERKKLITTIQSLPACSAEQQRQVEALIANISNPANNQALCNSMPLPLESLRGLRMAYQLEQPK